MTEQEKKELQERVKSVIERVNNAAVQAGRDPSEITLVVATKMNDAERVQAAIEAGIPCVRRKPRTGTAGEV